MTPQLTDQQLTDQQLRSQLFDEIPSGIVVIDESLTVVDHNLAFASIFGEVRGEPCYQVTKGRSARCPTCPALATFQDGQQRVVEQTGTDSNGRDIHYLVQVTPINNHGEGPRYVAAITTDLTATKLLQQEYGTLFEKVPCFVAVINRDYRVVKANEVFRRVFGEPTGQTCHELFKRRRVPCPDCQAALTFADGEIHSNRQLGISQSGKPTPYLVSTAPLLRGGNEVTHVIEMALDMTEHDQLEEELSQAHAMRLALVESSLDAILVLDRKACFVLVNQAAEQLLGYGREQLIGQRCWQGLLPAAAERVLHGKAKGVVLHDSELRTAGDETIAVRIAAVRLGQGGRFMGSALIIQDLRKLKQLEHEKLEAERLAAVGQTVAGLAHGIKNIITGLEGGMYVTSTGLKRGDEGRLRQGWEMLERNVGRISALSRNLLAFSRGERLDAREVQPAAIVTEVAELYRDSARRQGIEISAEIPAPVANAYLDPEGMHSCLANLISNAVDACLTSERDGCTIVLRLFEEDDCLVFEVVDSGCGMDYEVKQRAFTSFFTTKGRGGTGIGLLLTRKIVQQHGGEISFTSTPGAGTRFRLSFPRCRLPRPAGKEQNHEKQRTRS